MDLFTIFEKISSRERIEWSEGDGTNNAWDSGSGYNRGRNERSRSIPPVAKIWSIVIALFVLFAIVFPSVADFAANYYWFSEYGFSSVFVKKLMTQWGLFLLSFIPASAILYFNWNYARKNAERFINRNLVPGFKVTRGMICLIVLVVVGINSLAVTSNWDTFLKFLHPSSFGQVDPLFGNDISFYVFTLPFIVLIKAWLQKIIFLSLMGSLLVYFMHNLVGGSVTFAGVQKSVKNHIAFLVSMLSITWAIGFYLDRFSILYSPTGVVYGGGYTDVNVILPIITIFVIGCILLTVGIWVDMVKPLPRKSYPVFGAFCIVAIAMRIFMPGIIQEYRVKPNEYEMEKNYLEYSLNYTRHAYGLDNVETVDIKPEDEISVEGIKANNETLRNVRMWDYPPLLRTYRQLQAIRTYYNFSNVFIDRYEIDGENRQVMLSVRELDLSHFQNPTWLNTHLEFTHGFGVVMNPVNEIASGGLPKFFMKDLPINSAIDINVVRPEIYFGLMGSGYVLVNTDVKEFDYPMGDSNVRGHYEGKGGIPIDSFWKKLVFAIKFQDSEILFTGALKPESRIMYNRQVRSALKKVAPFILFDDDTYPVIYNGRIIWVQDAYTWSRSYPYSRPFYSNDPTMHPFRGVNYLRNSVKATVDAYDGSIKFYVVDDSDPVIKTWSKIFPKLFNRDNEMSEELWKHMRYPEDFFSVQADMYRTYHMTDTNTYYNREDVWEVADAGDKYGRNNNISGKITPNYVTMKLWGRKNAEFALILPYMPLGRNNMIGWMAGRCDPENYGELLVYKFPKQKLVYGPGQVEALINQNPEISAQLSLWSQRGSDVIKGELLVIPVGRSILYVQPLYLKAETGELPELKRIITSTGGRITWGETFEEALSRLMKGKTVVNRNNKYKGHKTEDSSDNNSLTAKELNMAKAHYDNAISAQRAGDWARYGEEIKALGQILSVLQEK